MKSLAHSIVFAVMASCTGSTNTDASTDVAIDTAADIATDTTDDVLVDTPPVRYVMPACDAPRTAFAPLGTRCQHFVDAEGRAVVLHGINARIEGLFDVTFDDGRAPLEPIPPFTIDDARRMRQLGFSLLRLPVNWSGLEPTDHGATQLDAAYLARMHAAVDLAGQAGLLVLIDFHEDAWSKEIGEDGAPLWAIQPPPTMLLGGPLTDLDQRRASTQVLGAFDTFFSSATTGAMLRTRFASMAAAVATSFRGDTTVIGYELFNEPISAPGDLLRFHTEAAQAVRDADPGHLVVFEPSAARNLLDRAPLATAPFPVSGGVYAPHIYTLSLNGTDAQRTSMTRQAMRPSWTNAANERRSWGTPMLVTEWGYGPDGIRAADYFAYQEDLQDEFGASAIFWLWKERSQGGWGLFDYDDATNTWTERAAMRAQLARVMPEAIAGWPTSWSYDRETRRFELRYAGDAAVTAPTRVYVPEPADFVSAFEVTCDGATVNVTRDAATGIVDVPCAGAGEHVVVVVGAR